MRLLGPFEVLRDNVPITPSAPKLRQVLALLAINVNGIVRTDQIIEELWEEHPPLSSTTTLQTYIYQLRKLLKLRSHADQHNGTEPPANATTLYTSPDGYRLRFRQTALDSWRFEQLASQGRTRLESGDFESAASLLRAAQQLWRGSALTAIGPGPVLQAEVVRLEEAYKTVKEQRIDADLQLGRHRELIGELTGLVTKAPTHEGFQAKLMLALYRSGRRSEALEVYRRARSALAGELGLEPSSELRKLHLAILAGDPAINEPAGNTVVASGKDAAAPPNQLPPTVPTLVGHEVEFARVRAELTEANRAAPPVAVVFGPPGVGKSSFAVHVAHAVRADYPDGQLYARLLTADRKPVDVGTVLADFCHAIGIPERRIPESVEERSRLFRGWSADRKVLVVVDDVLTVDQLVALLPTGPGCAMIATSRRRLADQAISTEVSLAPLGNDNAVEMLVAMLGQPRVSGDPQGVSELVGMCHGMPVALRAVGTRLALRPHWPVGHLMAMIRSGQRQLLETLAVDEVDVSMSVAATYQAMPQRAQTAFRVVAAQAQASLSSSTAAAMLGVDEQTAEAALEDLVEFQLADIDEPNENEERYSFRYSFRPLFRTVAGSFRDETEAIPVQSHPGAGRPSQQSTLRHNETVRT
ncbi:MAG TPA: BTAD domain-containing putative transcriptional regulator [Pseudonocardiaceae bacterium]|nr:BTAD domain-containing putative transcriptional regulator [Pseudonocardiaceae bacterium]